MGHNAPAPLYKINGPFIKSVKATLKAFSKVMIYFVFSGRICLKQREIDLEQYILYRKGVLEEKFSETTGLVQPQYTETEYVMCPR